MIFNLQPSGLVGAKSPIIYQAYDGLYASSGFYYNFKVYVWSGSTTIPASPIATIQRKPDQFGSGRGWIDVHKLVQQYLTTDYLINGTYKPNIGNGAVNVAVKVQGIYSTGTTSEITSNVVLATNGYSYTEQGVNANLSKLVYTDKTQFNIPLDTPYYYVWYDATNVTSIDINGTAVIPNSGSTSSYKIQGVDLIQLITASGQTGNCVVDFNTSSGTTSYNIIRECENKYGNVTMHYLNKYGVYDSYTFNALSRNSINVSRESYNKPIYRQADLTTAWSYGVQITQPFNTNASKSIMVNTDFISENDNQIIEQFFVSDNILIVDGSSVYSAMVSDTSFQEKTRVNDKLIQYTMNLTYNQTLINKIVR